MDKNNLSQLGKILVDKGIITNAQLDLAIAEQTRRRQNLKDEKALQATALGEILIEMGFIDRLQLKRSLNWQKMLRNFTMAMALFAPVMGFSTGAAAASSSSTSSAPRSSLPQTIEAENYTTMYGVQTETTQDVSGVKDVGYINPGDWMSFSGTNVYIPTTGTYKITYRLASPTGGGSFVLKESDSSVTYDTVPVPSTGGFQTWVDVVRQVTLPAGTHTFLLTDMVRGSGFNINWFKIEAIPSSSSSSSSSRSSVASSVSSVSSAPAASSVSSQQSSSAPAAAMRATAVAGPVNLTWTVPAKRENLTVLDITELGGYELRYKLAGDTQFTYVTINDPWTSSYQFSWLEGTYNFQIAAFDKDGLYSIFVDLIPH